MKVGMFGKRRIGAQIGPRNSTPRNLSGLKKFEKLCLREKKNFHVGVFFSDCQISPESLFSADATKKCEIARRGSDDKDADGEREQDEATLEKCPNLGRYPLKF